MKCLRCNHEWNNEVKLPKRCPKCKSPYWNKPKRDIIGTIDPGPTHVDYRYDVKKDSPGEILDNLSKQSGTNYDIQRLTAQIDSLHEEVANKQKLIEKLTSERLPALLVTDPLGKAKYNKLEVNQIISIPSKMYAPLKSILILAMRDRSPEIKLELKDNEIVEIL
jgi:hypothetical protein